MVAVEGYTKSKTLRITEDIRKFRKDPYNWNDKEIQHELGLTDRMWRRYNRMVNQQDKKIWYELTKDQLESELLKLKVSYEETYQVAKQGVKDSKTIEEKLLASETKDNARLDIIRLMVDGPDYTKKIDQYVSEKSNISKQKQKQENTNREITN